jgi:hypothetical protein
MATQKEPEESAVGVQLRWQRTEGYAEGYRRAAALTGMMMGLISAESRAELTVLFDQLESELHQAEAAAKLHQTEVAAK